jgi:catechol 2,3-dioxygenase-like lactoylglutathione lyase family enzyme
VQIASSIISKDNMFKPIKSFSGFSINDLASAKQFYTETLGMQVTEEGPGLLIHHTGGGSTFAYVKENHEPASYTVLNFEVENIDEAVEALGKAGIQFERYKEMPQDESGIMRGLSRDMGPDVAWFKDPSGNILAVMQEK